MTQSNPLELFPHKFPSVLYTTKLKVTLPTDRAFFWLHAFAQAILSGPPSQSDKLSLQDPAIPKRQLHFFSLTCCTCHAPKAIVHISKSKLGCLLINLLISFAKLWVPPKQNGILYIYSTYNNTTHTTGSKNGLWMSMLILKSSLGRGYQNGEYM